MAKLRISIAARRDLDEIQDFGVKMFGGDAARRHMAGFARIFALLRNHPQAGQPRPDYGEEVRLFPHPLHRVLYRAGQDELLIIRILHHSRDVHRAMARAE